MAEEPQGEPLDEPTDTAPHIARGRGPGLAPGGPPRRLPPLSRRVAVIAMSVLGLTVAAVVVDRRRVREGELVVRTGGHDVRVSLTRDGREVQPPTERRFFTLSPGTYDVALLGASEGLRAVPDRVTVEHAKRVVVVVEGPPPAPLVESVPPGK
jgi:hypothetical protein